MTRPEFIVPPSTDPRLAAMLVAASARKWVWVNAEGITFWLNEGRAKAIHARNGGQLFPPISVN